MKAALSTLELHLNGFTPRVGVVLGSGLGFFAEEHMEVLGELPYSGIPGMSHPTVNGHKGRFLWGRVGHASVLCMQGRLHYYEGYSMQQITEPVRLMTQVGIQTLILTNAAGGIRDDLVPGRLMLISDHINMMGDNPLIGPNDDRFGDRFCDMTYTYCPELRTKAKAIAEKQGLLLSEGVYIAVSGPSFETPAEIRAFRTLGADAVGMSTVPEAIIARHAGLRVAAVSCITNKAAGLGSGELSHEEVAREAAKVKTSFAEFLCSFVESC
ncbi:MAG: purine-nucleoside phosphorylase [Opitutales bacterium]|nr:purine-nucleoside phosphorylase [Opitutales bacterium]